MRAAVGSANFCVGRQHTLQPCLPGCLCHICRGALHFKIRFLGLSSSTSSGTWDRQRKFSTKYWARSENLCCCGRCWRHGRYLSSLKSFRFSSRPTSEETILILRAQTIVKEANRLFCPNCVFPISQEVIAEVFFFPKSAGI